MPVLVVGALTLLAVGSATIASLALAHVVPGWAVFFFYTLPGLFFVGWAAHEFSPGLWRRLAVPLRRVARGLAGGRLAPARGSEQLPALPPPAARPGLRERLFGPDALARLEEGTIGPWLVVMRMFLAAWRSPRVRRALNVGFGVTALAITAAVADRFAAIGWPLARADVQLVIGACALLLSSFAFKAVAWQRVFRPYERPRSLTLAAATGFASVAGIALPGRFDDAVRLTVVRRLSRAGPGIGTLALSLFLLGLLDTAAMTPLAATAAIASNTGLGVRIAFGVVAGAGVGAAALAGALPRVARSSRLTSYRLGHWLGRHAPGSTRDAWTAAILVLASWISRAVGILILLDAFGFGTSFPLAVAYLSAGAASGALPISPAGAATQAGVGAAVLGAAGVSGASAVAFAVATQALTILAGGALALFAALVHAARRSPA